MKALSIRQPWAWLILHAGKDIENRTWPTDYRGRVFIHASKRLSVDEWRDAWLFDPAFDAIPAAMQAGILLDTVDRGGIVGTVEICDCVTSSESPWFVGPFGFVLRNPIPLPFNPCRGFLGLFDLPDAWDVAPRSCDPTPA